MSWPRRVDVVGGGISGLTTAYRLAAAGVDVTVHEASDRPGGKLGTVQVGDLRLETGADSFVARKPWAVDLCRELGLAGELVAPGAKGAYLWTDRGLVAFPKDAPFGIPGDIGDVMRWPGRVAGPGRRRAAQDLLRGKRKDGVEETLGALLRRRLGDEATDMAVAPLLAGLYAGDVDRLSARATFPELLAWESTQGSLIRRFAGGDALGSPRDAHADVREAEGRGRTPHRRARRVARRPGGDRGAGRLARRLAEREATSRPPCWRCRRSRRRAWWNSHAPAAADDLRAIPYASTGVVFLVFGEGTQASLPGGPGSSSRVARHR